MTFRRVLLIIVLVFALTFAVKAFKKHHKGGKVVQVEDVQQEGDVSKEPRSASPILIDSNSILMSNEENDKKHEEADVVKERSEENINIIDRLFTTGHNKLPIVETIAYRSRVPWLKGRPAWIADYASYYSTSRHFIARSLNKKADYYTQKVSPGDQFNILHPDKQINFYLLIDAQKAKMWFYYIDLDEKEKVLLKTYQVGLGAIKNQKSATPTGCFLLGDKVATYKPGIKGFFQNEKVEMINVFGTRWLPFKEELVNCSDSAKGYGLHGLPIEVDPKTHELKEHIELLGQYASDGCIRLKREDIEELYSIVISRPTIVEILEDTTQRRQDSRSIPDVIAFGK